jgi:uncharacterized protein YjiS (DUF1127 family)
LLLKPVLAVDLRARWPLDRDADGLAQHWHQPLLPDDCKSAHEALGAAISSLLARYAVTVRRLATTPALWVKRLQSRRKLAELSDYMLRDIGLTRADVWKETSKPFWRD